MNQQDLFSGFFGGAAGLLSSAEAMLHHAFNPKSDDITTQLELSLSDVYLGNKKPIVLDRKKGCTGCRGAGRVMTVCRGCQGNGISMATIQPFPGYIQQVAQECHLCRGTGYAGRGNCPTCHGQGSVVEKRHLDVRIPTDCRKHHEIVFSGLGHHLLGEEPGDAVVMLRVRDHPVFTRRGVHLYIEKSITLSEAMCGTALVVETLDGRSLLIRNNPSSMITPASLRVVEREGMPVPTHHTPSSSRTHTYGNLYIKFHVIFPSSLDTETCRKLQSLLPARPPLQIDRTREDVEEVQLCEFEREYRETRGETGGETGNLEQDSDEDYDLEPGVQCVQQ